MFWLSAFCSRSRKAKLAITLIQLLAKRENSKKLKHIRLFSPSVLYPYFQQGLTNLGVLWKVQHSSLCTCPLAFVHTWEKLLPHVAPFCAGGGWMSFLNICVAYGSATSSLIHVGSVPRFCFVYCCRISYWFWLHLFCWPSLLKSFSCKALLQGHGFSMTLF